MNNQLENDIKEIRKICPCCSFGMGLFKVEYEKTNVQKKIKKYGFLKLKSKEEITFDKVEHGLYHLDLFATSEAGCIYNCKAYPIIKQYIAYVDEYENPIFTESFQEEYDKIQETFGQDMTNKDYSFEEWSNALFQYFNNFYEIVDGDAKFEGAVMNDFKPYYDKGLNIEDTLNEFEKK